MCLCVRALTGTAGLQVHGIGVAGVKERHGGGSGEGVDAVQKRLVVQVVESTVRLSRFVCRPEEDGTADEFILNGAGSQTPALRLDLMNRETEGGVRRKDRKSSVRRCESYLESEDERLVSLLPDKQPARRRLKCLITGEARVWHPVTSQGVGGYLKQCLSVTEERKGERDERQKRRTRVSVQHKITATADFQTTTTTDCHPFTGFLISSLRVHNTL